MGLILSIDVGTTNVKAALVNEDGQMVGEVKSLNIAIESDASGRAEHDPVKLKAELFEICKLAIGNRGQEIDCFSLTSYMFGLLLVDKDNHPLTNISTFLDKTSQSHHPKFLEIMGDVDQLYLRTGCPPIFQFSINRLHHIVTKDPSLKNRAAYVLDSKAFIVHLLTGEYCTDYSTANSMGCLDVDGNWDRKIIEAVGFKTSQFPKVVNGFTEKIELRESVCNDFGLKKGTGISVGLFDGAALTAALTGFEPKIAVGNFGTSGMFRVPTSAPIQDLDGGAIHSCLLKPGSFFTGSGINNCTISSNLLLNVLGLGLDYLKTRELSTPGSNGLMTFPYFTGERDKIIGNIGTGMIFGLSLATSRDDLARSFLEGVALSFLFVKQKLDPDNQIKEFRLGGGGASNLPWMQIMADTLNLPIRLTQNPEMGIIGAACIAMHGEGSDLLECSRRIMKETKVIEPIAKNVSVYQELSSRYFDVRSSLKEPLMAFQGLLPLKPLVKN